MSTPESIAWDVRMDAAYEARQHVWFRADGGLDRCGRCMAWLCPECGEANPEDEKACEECAAYACRECGDWEECACKRAERAEDDAYDSWRAA